MFQNNVSIIDYGIGNIMSVRRGFEYCGSTVALASTEDEILSADRLVIPGVGAFRNGMDALLGLGFVDAILEKAHLGTPILGICLGMQLLFSQSSEFGKTNGLGLISGEVVEVPKHSRDGFNLKIPNIGWRNLQADENGRSWEDTLLDDISTTDEMYFVHSYTAVCDDLHNRIAVSEYGGFNLTAVVQSQNIYGCQFHPEKSGDAGLRLLNGFIKTT